MSSTKEGTCSTTDVSCYPNWASEASGVARISFIEHGNSYLCTGCLLATANATIPQITFDSQPLRHRAKRSRYGRVLLVLIKRQRAMDPPGHHQRAATTQDLICSPVLLQMTVAFLRMRQRAPGGAAHLSRSVNPPGDGESLTGIHHPDGSFKRISFGTTAGTSDDFWAVQWFDGVTEPGSSGSPLFNANHQVIGQLNGGFNGPGSSCDNPSAPDQYGRFDLTYNSVKRWLDSSSPPGTDFSAVKGTYNGLVCGFLEWQPAKLFWLDHGQPHAKGKFTAKLQIGAQRYSSAGQFDSNGDAQVQVRRSNLSPLSAGDARRSRQRPSDQITGQVGRRFMDRADRCELECLQLHGQPFSSRRALHPAIAGAPGSDNEPAGAGYATLTADRAGRVNLVGSLADGTKISQSAYVSRDGEWPLYIALYGNGGSVLSWLSFLRMCTGTSTGSNRPCQRAITPLDS
jgi:hypothetical protein